MTELRESIDVPLTSAQARDAILRYFETRRNGDGEIEIALRLPLSDFGLPGGVEIAHPVRVSVRRRRDQQNLNDEIAISWKASEDGLVYPAFSGWLIVWSEDQPKRSFIELRGTYEPPLGNAGVIFDAAVGRRIAEHTARLFLEDLRKAVDEKRRTGRESEPVEQQIEALAREEERRELLDTEISDESKSEILERLDRLEEADLERSRADGE